MALGRGRGRPRKKVQPPSYDDYPVDAPKDVQERWVQKKATEQWRYNKLMSASAAEYRKAENERASRYYHMKKKKNPVACATANDPDQFCDDDDGSIQQQKDDTAKEKSRLR